MPKYDDLVWTTAELECCCVFCTEVRKPRPEKGDEATLWARLFEVAKLALDEPAPEPTRP